MASRAETDRQDRRAAMEHRARLVPKDPQVSCWSALITLPNAGDRGDKGPKANCCDSGDVSGDISGEQRGPILKRKQ